jgi:hypothetical protein
MSLKEVRRGPVAAVVHGLLMAAAIHLWQPLQMVVVVLGCCSNLLQGPAAASLHVTAVMDQLPASLVQYCMPRLS